MHGHTILAPGEEWEPINNEDGFVKFKGEENEKPYDLEKKFLSAIDQSDAFVIVDFRGYTGMLSSHEYGYALARVLENSNRSELRTIFFTEPPLGYNLFETSIISREVFKREIVTNKQYSDLYIEFNRKSGQAHGGYTSLDDFYDELSILYFSIKFLQDKGVLKIGIDELLSEKQIEGSDIEER